MLITTRQTQGYELCPVQLLFGTSGKESEQASAPGRKLEESPSNSMHNEELIKRGVQEDPF